MMKHVGIPLPSGKRVAVCITVLLETWSEGNAPSYSVQTTPLKPGTVNHAGISWASYGAREGVWRILRTLDRHKSQATFFTSARCVEDYPASVRGVVAAGHDIAGHAYTQDGLLTYLDAEEERATIHRSLDLLNSVSARPVTGWLSPVLAFTPRTPEFLAEAGLTWHSDVNYADLPHAITTPSGQLIAIPNSDFTDNRVLRGSPRDWVDVYTHTIDFLREHEPGSFLAIALHCQFGGRPMMVAALNDILAYYNRLSDVWIVSHETMAKHIIQQGQSMESA
ncbi:polysaccharide deacetylase family protein [Dyella jejuensis]|uniref:Polysaccharide deacetylase family protein n=1 Tax=Dyella jejuensis TaxID=1432009 RepID=A0ABW8JNH4_9GAMM